MSSKKPLSEDAFIYRDKNRGYLLRVIEIRNLRIKELEEEVKNYKLRMGNTEIVLKAFKDLINSI